MKASIIESENPNNRITIKNSVFKNNILNKNLPMFYLIKSNVR